MPYNANIPQPTDQISDSQNDLLNNFQTINAWVLINHGGFDSPPNTGKHLYVEMPLQAAASTPVLNEVGLQCLASAFTTTQGANAPTLAYLQNALPPIEMTSGLMAGGGWSFLPSGLLLKWGSITIGALGAGTKNLNGAGIPSYADGIYYVGFTLAGDNATPDPNISLNINTTTTTLATLGYTAVARDSSIPTVLIQNVYYYVVGS
jgi:hypothetical protein